MGIVNWLAKALTGGQVIPRLTSRKIRALTLQSQFSRIGGGMTPLQVSAILQSADTGNIYRFVDLQNESRQKDCHLQSLLGTREIALPTLQWKVTPAVAAGEAIPTDEDRRIAVSVGAALADAEGDTDEQRSFSDMVAHLTGAVYYGYGVAELIWAKQNGMLVPTGFIPTSPRRFCFSYETGRLQWSDEQGIASGVNLQERYPYKFIQHQPRINGDVPAREGLGRLLVWTALFRNWNMTDWLRLAELAWKPWRVAKYAATASTEDIDHLEDVLRELTSNGVATLPDRVGLEIHWPAQRRGNLSQHAELAQYLGMEMSKAVLGQTLTVEQGERGARSLGEVHDRVRRDIREGDAQAMAQTVRRDIILPFVRLNYGPDVLIPRFHFVTEDTIDLGAFARAVESLQRAGTKITQAWVRDRVGAPDPEPDEEILEGSKPAPAEAPAPMPEQPSAPQPTAPSE